MNPTTYNFTKLIESLCFLKKGLPAVIWLHTTLPRAIAEDDYLKKEIFRSRREPSDGRPVQSLRMFPREGERGALNFSCGLKQMIQFISVIDIEGGGISKWDFIHPAAPKQLRERLEKYRKLASSFIYAVITAFGEEIVGQRIRELRLSEIKFIFMPLEHDGTLYYVVSIVDMKDNPVATQRAFMNFYKNHYHNFDEILTGISVSKSTMERLRSAMEQFLVPLAWRGKFFGKRDKIHLSSSYLVSLLFSGLLTGILWGSNELFRLMETNPILMALLVFGGLFVLPGILIGYLTQYGRHAIGVAFLNSLTIVFGATFLWQNLLLSSAETIIGTTVSKEILIASSILMGLMLGTMLALVSFLIAKFFERRKLTCIKRLQHIPKLTKEEKEEPPTHTPPSTFDSIKQEKEKEK